MASAELILLDTSVLIDYFRKKDKTKSYFYFLTQKYSLFAISVITEYEIQIGTNEISQKFWYDFFEKVMILPFDRKVNQFAIKIFNQLKSDNKIIEIPDIFIGATALSNRLKIATLNRKHFDRIEGLEILDKLIL